MASNMKMHTKNNSDYANITNQNDGDEQMKEVYHSINKKDDIDIYWRE